MRIFAIIHTTAGKGEKYWLTYVTILFQTQVGELIGDNDLYVFSLYYT